MPVAQSAYNQNISILNAEKLFLSHLQKLALDFPKLRIVLEHATTAEAVECVRRSPRSQVRSGMTL